MSPRKFPPQLKNIQLKFELVISPLRSSIFRAPMPGKMMERRFTLAQRFLVTALPIITVGCTSIMGAESNKDRVVIRDHSLSGSGESAVFGSAKSYCGQYNAKASLRNKIDAKFLTSEYDYYYFDCIAEQPKPQPTTKQSSSTTPISVSIESAKEKCMDLGFKTGTEEFGKCALQLSR